MGKHKKSHFINKNDPSTATFSLVAASHDDPRRFEPKCFQNNISGQSDAIEPCSLKPIVRSNLLKKGNKPAGLPAKIADSFDPELFGIHSNLDEKDLENLCKTVYGKLLPDIQNRLPKPTVIETKNDADLDRLEKDDCYFPLDGYDYNQHLAPCSKDYSNFSIIENETRTADAESPVDLEEKEILEALENADAYETLSDDFAIQEGEVENEHELMWGHKPDLDEFDFKDYHQYQYLEETSENSENSENSEEILVTKDQKKDISDADVYALLEEEYNEDDVGELDCEEPGKDDLLAKKVMDQWLNRFENSRPYQSKKGFCNPEVETNEYKPFAALGDDLKDKILSINSILNDQDTDHISSWLHRPKKPQWDCETVLSTCSRLYNHPSKISNPQKQPNTSKILHTLATAKTPNQIFKVINSLDSNRQPNVTSTYDEDEYFQLDPVITKRDPNETTEQKHARKKTAKLTRRLLRKSKKINDLERKEQNKESRLLKNPYDIQPGVRKIQISV